MRDLEPRIKLWRDRLQVSPEMKDELEEHLSELLQAKLKEGKLPEEAFDQAILEMGAAEKISAEYLKLERTVWWPVRTAVWATIILAALLSLVYASILYPTKPREYAELVWILAPHVVTVTFGYSMTYLLGGLGICFVVQRFFAELTPGQAHSLTTAMFRFSVAAAVFTAAGLVLGMLWAYHAWGRIWGWDAKESGAAALLLWQVCFLAFQASRFANIERTMLFSILGNIVVSAAWFGGSSILILLTVVFIHVAIIGTFSARSKEAHS